PWRVLAGAGVVVVGTTILFSIFNSGVEFFVDREPERAIVLVSARCNLSAANTPELAREVEKILLDTDGVKTVFTRAAPGMGVSAGARGDIPNDLIAQLLIEFKPYEERRKGAVILEEIRQKTQALIGIKVEVRKQEEGPPTG